MKNLTLLLGLILAASMAFVSCKKDNGSNAGVMQLASISVGTTALDLQQSNTGVVIDQPITVKFNNILDTASVRGNALLKRNNTSLVPVKYSFLNNTTAVITPLSQLENDMDYIFTLSPGINGAAGESFPGITVMFKTVVGKLTLKSISLNGINFMTPNVPKNIDYNSINLNISFSHPLNPANYKSYFTSSPNPGLNLSLSADSTVVTITNNNALKDYTHYYFFVSPSLKSNAGYSFAGFNNTFYTKLDSSLKFPLISDDALLTLIQQQTFKYFYNFAHPASGMTRERNSSGDIVTTGGSGFGMMALIVGMERNFITRSQGTTQLGKMLNFLETCDRYHGAWPHWLNGNTGKTVPFSPNDNGADLVETSFMVQGLLTMRQYLNPLDIAESALITRINTLCNAVEYDWFTRGQNVLYWHWSPNNGWAINMKLQGYNETLITYVVAASSTTHTIPAAAYTLGYTRNGQIANGSSYFGIQLPLGEAYGGPLFFTHYSYLGLDPRNLQDALANYWTQNVNHSLINNAWCVQNPNHYVGYSSASWGLTASDNKNGYSAHSPNNDLGVISPTAAVSALPYTPVQSMQAIRHFYYILGDKLWGDYGFYDAFDVTHDWWADSYLAIDQGPQIIMIENYRTGKLWDLFMSCPEVDAGLTKLGFSH